MSSSFAFAGVRGVAPASGGFAGIDVQIENGAIVVRKCAGADCAEHAKGPGKTIPIAIERSRQDLTTAKVETIPIGEGRSIVHVRVADVQRKDLAFEALVSGHSDEPIFAGLTGYTRGDDADRTGQAILVYDRDATSKFVIVANTREGTRICGQALTPVTAQGLDPKSMQLRGATMHRLDAAVRAGATPVNAVAHAGGEPLAQLLVATGASADGATALTDGKADTFWSEKRPGDGHGEFATLRTPFEVPLTSLTVTIAPTSPRNDGASPRTLFVATDKQLFKVTIPDDSWSKPGTKYDIPLPEVQTSCVALVLDEAYSRGLTAPEVSITEVSARSKLESEGKKLDEVVKELSTARGEEAAAILTRGGDDAFAAIAKVFRTLDDRGRALATSVATSGTCEGPSMEILTHALLDKESEVRKRARARIEQRCGKQATDSLITVLRSEDEARKAAVAPILANIAPAASLEPIVENLGKGKPATRSAMRGAFGRALTSAPRDKLLGFLKNQAPVTTKLDLLRAMGPRLPELRPESASALAEILLSTPDMPSRYVAAEPLSYLARATDATSGELTRFAELIRKDAEWPVRAHAIDLSAEITAMHPMIVDAAGDPEPRVREAALRAIAKGKIANGGTMAARSLNDPWTFVRTAATEALGVLPESGEVHNALSKALADASPKVRGSAVTAIGGQRTQTLAPKVRERLDDTKEDVEVRSLAARTLGALCVRSATDRLTKLALLGRAPVDEADERLSMAAIDALSALHPPDLDKRLAPLRGKDVRIPLRKAADHAISEPGLCR